MCLSYGARTSCGASSSGEAGEQLLHVTGAVEGGPRIFEGALRSCHEHDLRYEALARSRGRPAFPRVSPAA